VIWLIFTTAYIYYCFTALLLYYRLMGKVGVYIAPFCRGLVPQM
jgi:hypothetical protein